MGEGIILKNIKGQQERYKEVKMRKRMGSQKAEVLYSRPLLLWGHLLM
jgi:hypothetical protein